MMNLDRIARRELRRREARERAIRAGRGRPEMLGISHMCGFGVGGASKINVVDYVASDVVFLCNFDGSDGSTTFTEEKNGLPISTVNGTQLDTAQAKYGASSALFVASNGDYATCNHASLELGAGDFTVACWAKWAAVSGDRGLFQLAGSTFPGSYAPLSVLVGGTNAIALYHNAGFTYSASNVIDTSVWHHVAVVGYGSTTTLYVDGIAAVTRTKASMAGNLYLTIGGAYSGAYTNDGWIDSMIVLKMAHYVGQFEPPTDPYAIP